MRHSLVVAEKPSVARSIAAAIGAKDYREGYIEGNGYLVSWCFGHLADFVNADAYDEKYRKWCREDLPIVPEAWRYSIPRDKFKQYDILRGLLHRSDVDEVINACDAGREGERIFRSVYNLSGCDKPMQRLWISSMEDGAIREGFRNLRPGSEYDNLYAAAECRAKADWLVGINTTRLFSCTYHRTLNVGRVVSPALALIVNRQNEIDSFAPEPFYTTELTCSGVVFSSERVHEKSTAEDMLLQAKASPLEIHTIKTVEKTEKAPALYDLTSLQRDANKELGYTAQQTLDYLQSLYEKKLCTYPRTDSRYLTEDMVASIPRLICLAAEFLGEEVPQTLLTKQVCDNSKVSDHHAIVLTGSADRQSIASLPSPEKDLLALVALRMLCAISEAHCYRETLVHANCGGTVYKATGKQLVEIGWRRFLKKPLKDTILPNFWSGQQFIPEDSRIKEGTTEPPRQYTEGTLLTAMENAGDQAMPEDAERRGIGTPATRSGIIEKLVATGFITRHKNKKSTSLVPAETGKSLILVLPEELKSPLLTAEWENKLLQIEHGELSAEIFLQDISAMVATLTDGYCPVPNAEKLFPSGREVIGICPRCGSQVTESKAGFFCECNECRFGLWRDNKYLTSKHIVLSKSIVKNLLQSGLSPHLKMYSERTGKEFEAALVMQDNGERTTYSLRFEPND